MKTLLLLRHAHARPAERHQADYDRPLRKRGRKACRALADELGPQPGVELALCSGARRARETLEGLGDTFAPAQVAYTDALYLASDDALLETLWGLDDRLARVLLVGHNPGLQDLARRLTGGGDDAARERASAGMPPAAFAELCFEPGPWGALRDRSGRLMRFVAPDPRAA